MTFDPVFRKQLDGSAHQHTNCGPASLSSALDRHQLGVDPPGTELWKPTPANIRSRMIALGIENGVSGTSSIDLTKAATRLYGAALTTRYNLSWADYVTLIVSGRGAITNMGYAALHGNVHDACPTCNASHWIYVDRRRWNATRGYYQFLVYDPLADHRRAGIPQGPEWWKWTVLQRVCAALRPGGVYCALFTKDTVP